VITIFTRAQQVLATLEPRSNKMLCASKILGYINQSRFNGSYPLVCYRISEILEGRAVHCGRAELRIGSGSDCELECLAIGDVGQLERQGYPFCQLLRMCRE
jgi:hypothetical protein